MSTAVLEYCTPGERCDSMYDVMHICWRLIMLRVHAGTITFIVVSLTCSEYIENLLEIIATEREWGKEQRTFLKRLCGAEHLNLKRGTYGPLSNKWFLKPWTVLVKYEEIIFSRPSLA